MSSVLIRTVIIEVKNTKFGIIIITLKTSQLIIMKAVLTSAFCTLSVYAESSIFQIEDSSAISDSLMAPSELSTSIEPEIDVKQSPKVGYGTFCGGDPSNPTAFGEDAGSSGDFSWGCPDANGADGTPEGTDYDSSWPIE